MKLKQLNNALKSHGETVTPIKITACGDGVCRLGDNHIYISPRALGSFKNYALNLPKGYNYTIGYDDWGAIILVATGVS